MKPTTEPAEDGQGDWAEELEKALAELETAAVQRAKSLVDAPVKALMDRIEALEGLVARLQKGPGEETGPTDSAAGTRRPEQSSQAAGERSDRVRGLPPVPSNLTITTLEEYVKALGFELENYRPSGGKVWIYHSEAEFGHVVEHLRRSGIEVVHYPNGRPRVPTEHYEIDPFRVIPNA